MTTYLHSNALCNLTLIQLEGLYLMSFEFNMLYNFKLDPTSMAGYKHKHTVKAQW